MLNGLVIGEVLAVTHGTFPTTVSAANRATKMTCRLLDKSTVKAMAARAIVMHPGVGLVDRIAGGDMTTGTMSSHADHGLVIDGRMISGEAAMTGGAVVRGAATGALLACCQTDERAGGPVALAASLMHLVVREAEGDTRPVARRPGMTVEAVGARHHAERVIGILMRDRKDAMTGIALSATALTHGERNQGASAAMAGGASAMLLVGTAHRHPGYGPLAASMAPSAIRRQAGQGTMVAGRMDGGEAVVTNIATAAAQVTGGRPGQGTVGVMAGSTGVMDFRVIGVNGVGGGRMASGAVGGH